jgi:hypothetical protein
MHGAPGEALPLADGLPWFGPDGPVLGCAVAEWRVRVAPPSCQGARASQPWYGGRGGGGGGGEEEEEEEEEDAEEGGGGGGGEAEGGGVCRRTRAQVGGGGGVCVVCQRRVCIMQSHACPAVKGPWLGRFPVCVKASPCLD